MFWQVNILGSYVLHFLLDSLLTSMFRNRRLLNPIKRICNSLRFINFYEFQSCEWWLWNFASKLVSLTCNSACQTGSCVLKLPSLVTLDWEEIGLVTSRCRNLFFIFKNEFPSEMIWYILTTVFSVVNWLGVSFIFLSSVWFAISGAQHIQESILRAIVVLLQ